MRRILRPFITLLALALIAYEWLWDWLRAQIQKLRALPGWLTIERWMRRLPPWASLSVMLLPLAVLFPFKLLAIWALGHGHAVLGAATYVFAKVVGMGLVSYVFDLVRENARRIRWFDHIYRFIMRVITRAKAWVQSRPVYLAVREWVGRVRAAVITWRAEARSPWARRIQAAKAALRREIG